ncbi:multiple coagulation factor deficiency protein 2 homolog [Dermacentor andersoni]|uniref:multiple coagulation factor deficiency protein 2 homolog n=1 Tax=Dermacentor andersoni TaxID=34620 RepID=UPI003B3AB233
MRSTLVSAAAGRTPVLAALCLWCVVVSCVFPKAAMATSGDGGDKVAEVRRKFGTRDVIHDIEHLKEDLKTITDLQIEGKLTEDETIFYFLRMHDFDDNNMLDGWELLTAMKHMGAHGHGKEEAETGISETVEAVDALMHFDKNNDGFLEYAELRSSSDEP